MIQSSYRRIRADAHPDCVVCGNNAPFGLGLEFVVTADGGVETEFDCDKIYQGYPDVMHGGIVSALLDAAMTNCLFARNVVAVTAELIVRYRHPTVASSPAVVRAWVVADERRPLYEMAAELSQNGQVKATAKGRFFDKASSGIFLKA